MASHQSAGGGTASVLATDDDVTIVAASTSLGLSTRRTRFSQTAQEIGQEFFLPYKQLKTTSSQQPRRTYQDCKLFTVKKA
jgi:hypothetical protein